MQVFFAVGETFFIAKLEKGFYIAVKFSFYVSIYINMMYFYYFFSSGVWRKKTRWQAVWKDVRPYALAFLAMCVVFHIYILPVIPLLALLLPAGYYLYALIRPSVYYTWDVDGGKFFCAVYYEQIGVLNGSGMLLSGSGREIFRKVKVRQCRNLDDSKILLVKIIDTGRFMLFNANYVNGLSLGKPLKNVNLAQGDSCFISGATISCVMNSGEVVFLPKVAQYKVLVCAPDCGETQIEWTDFMTGEEPMPVGYEDKQGGLVLDFVSDFPYERYLALRQSDGTEVLLCLVITQMFVRQVLHGKGARLTDDLFGYMPE